MDEWLFNGGPYQLIVLHLHPSSVSFSDGMHLDLWTHHLGDRSVEAPTAVAIPSSPTLRSCIQGSLWLTPRLL